MATSSIILLAMIAAALCSGSPIPTSRSVPDNDDVDLLSTTLSTTVVRRWMKPCTVDHEEHQAHLDDIHPKDVLDMTIKGTVGSIFTTGVDAQDIVEQLEQYFNSTRHQQVNILKTIKLCSDQTFPDQYNASQNVSRQEVLLSHVAFSYGRLSCISSLLEITLKDQTFSAALNSPISRSSFENLDSKINEILCLLLDVAYAVNLVESSNMSTPRPSLSPSQLISPEAVLEINGLPNAPNESSVRRNDWQFIVTSSTVQVLNHTSIQLEQLQQQAATGAATAEIQSTSQPSRGWLTPY